VHLRGSRNIGVDPHEIAEVFLHVALYAGIPAANAAFSVAKKEFDKPAPVSEEEAMTNKSQEDT
jgi:4-carboxymuconolactone decarboxylase